MKAKHLAAAFGLGAAALTAGSAIADMKLATLDTQEVINSTNAAKRAVATLKGKREAAQKQIDGMEAPLIEKRKKLAQQQSVLSADKFKAQEEAFGKEVAAFREKAMGIQQGLDRDNLALRKQIADAVRTVVEQIAKEKGYNVVLPAGVVLYNDATIPDISAEALKRANAILDK
jgi:Skp family chaperone for outer membrane proteins